MPTLPYSRVSVCMLFAAACIASWLTARPLEAARHSAASLQRGSQNPACTVLSQAEIRSITGFAGYDKGTPGDDPGQGIGGGASCQFGAPLFAIDARGKATKPEKGPLLSLVFIDGKNYTKTNPLRKGCRREAAAGVGDEAYFEVCPDSRLKRTPPLYVKAGTRDLILQMDVEAPDTDASLRPKVLALARAAVAKLR